MPTASAQLANSKWKSLIRIPSDSIGPLKTYMVTWTFTRVSDVCKARSQADASQPFDRIK